MNLIYKKNPCEYECVPMNLDMIKMGLNSIFP